MINPEQEPLEDRLKRYPVDRYPVQHATTLFQIGSSRLHAGDPAAAIAALTAARRVFVSAGLALEAAKATVMLGIGLRAAGRLHEAARAFIDVEQTLGGLNQPAEQAAAAYNLGLVLQDDGEAEAARQAWDRARELFVAAGFPAQAAAAARDHGASLLTAGDIGAALPLLQQAAELAELAGDDVGTSAAANVLGLAHLAAGDPASAVAVLSRGLAFVPRAIRAADHAMIKANLALAYERSGDAPRARLAARQARAVPSAAAAVRSQAQEVLSRLGGAAPTDDLFAVLDAEDRENWVAVVRDEVLRAAELSRADRTAWFAAFLDGILDRDHSHALIETLFAVVLEVPPATYRDLIEALVAGWACLTPERADEAKAVLESGMARFAMPQWQRLAASLNAAADAAGVPSTWR